MLWLAIDRSEGYAQVCALRRTAQKHSTALLHVLLLLLVLLLLVSLAQQWSYLCLCQLLLNLLLLRGTHL